MMKKYAIFLLLLLFTMVAKAQITDTISTGEPIYTTVEQPAAFPKGMYALYKYIFTHMRYPEGTERTKVDGRLVTKWHEINGVAELTFVVEKDGKLTDTKILEGISKEIDAELIRLMKQSPAWVPAKLEDKVVRQQYTFSIDFIQQQQ